MHSSALFCRVAYKTQPCRFAAIADDTVGPFGAIGHRQQRQRAANAARRTVAILRGSSRRLVVCNCGAVSKRRVKRSSEGRSLLFCVACEDDPKQQALAFLEGAHRFRQCWLHSEAPGCFGISFSRAFRRETSIVTPGGAKRGSRVTRGLEGACL
ncbi:hypothetical protein ZHAS_00014080 [Anopheles sinensis]|uniref:Uncharacterized protein n=1 Tax=Anopheles sinensis TaxID=74873 RepID=A0A084W7A8_ANOSI|nr:hypothetical protein ZHAS_00014080 [Anopheles sinensis]